MAKTPLSLEERRAAGVFGLGDIPQAYQEYYEGEVVPEGAFTGLEGVYEAPTAEELALIAQSTAMITSAKQKTIPQEAQLMSTIPVSTIPGQETVLNGVATFLNDADTGLYPVAESTAFPLVIAGGVGLTTMAIGAIRALIVKFGPALVKLLIGAAAFKEFLDQIGLGAPDATLIKVNPGGGKSRGRRYSIGRNPRVGTLAKVSRHCQKLLKKHEKVIREFIPRPKQYPARALASAYLSAAEKKALKA